MITARVGETQMIDRDDGNGPQPYALLSVEIPQAEAEALAAASACGPSQGPDLPSASCSSSFSESG